MTPLNLSKPRLITATPATDDIKINLITLSFSKDLEDDFLEEYFQKSLRHVRLALLLAIFFYGIFGILDAWLVPEAKEQLWMIRYAVFIPIVFAIFLFSLSKHFQKYHQLCISIIVVMAGLGIIAMIHIAPYPGSYSYYAG